MARGSDRGDTDSRASLPSRRQTTGRQQAARSIKVVDQDAFLQMREEWMQAKQREQAADENLKRMAAQLARTEEASKRILTRTDPTARGGTAAALLEAERQLAAAREEIAELGSQLSMAKKQAVDYKRQTVELKKRLETASSDQRRLALQLGRLQSGVHSSSYNKRPLSALTLRSKPAKHFDSCSPGLESGMCNQLGDAADDTAATSDPAAEAAAAATAKQFAEQQSRLAALLEHGQILESQLKQKDLVLHHQESELASLRAQLQDCSRKLSSAGADMRQSLDCPGDSNQTASTVTAAKPSQQSCTNGMEAPECNLQALRLKYLKSKSAIESLAASNTRLLQELEHARAQVAAAMAQEGELAAKGALTMAEEDKQQEQQSQDNGLAAAGKHVQLQQQLVAANHRAARLQIELDAAVAKLAVYQVHSDLLGHSTSHQESHPPKTLLQGAIVHQSKLTTETQTQRNSLHQQLSATSVAASIPDMQWAAGCRESADAAALLPHQNIVELHLHGAELDMWALETFCKEQAAVDSQLAGSDCLTFMTVDFFDSSTKLTPLAEGRSPLFNTTIQFHVGMSASLLDYLSFGTAKVELHRCRGASSADGYVDYTTVATAAIPLASLLPGSGGADYGATGCNYQRVTLHSTTDSAPCGVLHFALAALRPMCRHPGSNHAPVWLAPHSTGTSAHATEPEAHCRRLLVEVVGCKDLCPTASGSLQQPQVTLLTYATRLCTYSPCGVKQQQQEQQLVYETGKACSGSSRNPMFHERTTFVLNSRVALEGCQLEAVVFDGAVEDPSNSVVGVAHIHVPAASATRAGAHHSHAGAGRGRLHPLLHPISRRHTGMVELTFAWK